MGLNGIGAIAAEIEGDTAQLGKLISLQQLECQVFGGNDSVIQLHLIKHIDRRVDVGRR